MTSGQHALWPPPIPVPAWLRRGLFALVAAAPFLFLAAFALEPLVQQGVGSFFNWYDLKPTTFVGLHEYALVLRDQVARGAVFRTVLYVAITVPLEVGLGLAGAWLVLGARRGRAVLTTFFVLPLVIPWTSAATLLVGLFGDPGVLDDIAVRLFGAHGPVLWLGDPHLAFAVIVIAGVWKGTPWCFLLLLAALSACPVDVFEAGRMDGAGFLSFWVRVVVPAVRPMLVFVTVFRVFAEAQMYSSVALLAQGDVGLPVNATQLISTYDNTLAFQYFEFGQASALGTLTGAALLLVAGAGFVMMYRSPEAARRLGRRRAHLGMRRRAGRAGRRPFMASIKWGRRVNAGVVCAMAALTLVPLLGGAPNGALRLDFDLPWSLIGSGLANSAVLTVATLLGTLALALPAAYLLARVKFRLNAALFLVVLLTMAIPGAVVLLPQYQEIAWLGLINNRLGLALLYVAADLPFAVFFLRGAFASVPERLVESMRVDGASSWRTMTHLFIPLSASTIVTVAVFVVIQVWSELLLAATLLNSSSLYTMPVLAALGIGQTGALAASWISIGPPLAIFLVCRRTFQRGMLHGTLL